MTFREALNAQWFEVVERWTDSRGDREVIVFAGPLEQCGDYVIANNNGQLIIRVATF